MERARGNLTPVQYDPRRGTYRVSIPKAIADALDLAGAILEWVPVGRDTLKVIVHRREEKKG
ncbi:MAG: hypothetical protein QXU79_00140 [Candidatus Micrarchaeaceae archaeon]